VTIENAGVLSTFTYTFGIYQNPSTEPSRIADTDNNVVVYSMCTDSSTGQSRAVQALIGSGPPAANLDYAHQAGFGSHGQGNQN
jgi:hypothetical protein